MESVLLMPFTDDSESFTNGFECGQIWEKISEGDLIERHLVHNKNTNQLKMICSSFGVECDFEIIDETWSYLTTKNIQL